MLPMLGNNTSPAARALFWRHRGWDAHDKRILTKAVRRGQWKYVADPTERLFDLRVDPGERHSLASQHREVVVDLRQELANWEIEMGRDQAMPVRQDC